MSLRAWWWRATSVGYGRHSRDVVLRHGVAQPPVDRTRDSLAEDIARDDRGKPSTTPVRVARYGANMRGPRP